MKVEFRFNGANQIILIPENSKDKQLLQLWGNDRPILAVVPIATNPDCVAIEASQAPTEVEEIQSGRISLLDRKNLAP